MGLTEPGRADAGLATALQAPGLVGVLGGMGPLATIDFMRTLLNMTPASCDQEHVPLIVASVPQVPDRLAAFRGQGESPLKALIANARRLVSAGAGLIVMPCNTAHIWFTELQAALSVPLLHLVDVALEDVVASVGAQASVGLLCTDATLESGLYTGHTALASGRSLQWVLPSESEMRELVMPAIHCVKSGELERGRAFIAQAANALALRGARALVLGCTELPLILDKGSTALPLIDPSVSLALRTIAWSRAQQPGADALASPTGA